MNLNKKDPILVDGTMEDVLRLVQSITAQTYQQIAPVQVFQQGDRTMVSTAMPVKVLSRVLVTHDAQKGDTAENALNATNRPFVPDHYQGIVAYLKRALTKGENYIIPPITLNTIGQVEIYVPNTSAANKSGYMILPDEATIRITDGQHRFRAIKQVSEDLAGTPTGDKFLNTSVLVMMTLSDNNEQVHQDFADAGKTRALPPSLLAAYDTRQPANGAVMKIGERVPLLKGRVDWTSNVVSKSSHHIFLSNQLRQFVKHSLTGSTGTNEKQFFEQAENALSHPVSLKRWVDSRVAFLKVMTEVVPDWNDIAQLSAPNGADAASVVQKTKDIKQRKNVPMTGAFLTAIGLVSHQLLKHASSTDKCEDDWTPELREMLKAFHHIDWSRGADIWDGNIVVGKDKIRTQAPAVKGASERMLALLNASE